MKFKVGQLAFICTEAPERFTPGECIIVVGRRTSIIDITGIYYKIYLLKEQRITNIAEQFLSPDNPQEIQSGF